MISIKKIRYDDIEPVVLKMAEQVGIIKHELVDSQMIDIERKLCSFSQTAF